MESNLIPPLLTTDHINKIEPVANAPSAEILGNAYDDFIRNYSWWVQVCPDSCTTGIQSESSITDYFASNGATTGCCGCMISDQRRTATGHILSPIVVVHAYLSYLCYSLTLSSCSTSILWKIIATKQINRVKFLHLLNVGKGNSK